MRRSTVAQIEALLVEQREALVARDLERLNAVNLALAQGIESFRTGPDDSPVILRRMRALLRGQDELVSRARVENDRALAAFEPPQPTYGTGQGGAAAAAILRNTHLIA